MNRVRLGVAAISLVLVVGGFVWGATGLHHFGHYDFRYGAIVSKDSVADRAATNSVVTIAFDYRAFDTLGEEFILFISVVSVGVLLRRLRDEDVDEAEDLEVGTERLGSEALRWLGSALAAPLMLLGLYVITHGALTPGGGFQGGVIVMSAVAAIFLGGEYALIAKVEGSATFIEVIESAGAAGFAMIGFGGLIATGIFFANFINKGEAGLLTGGFIPIANVAVGVEVAGGFMMVVSELLYQRLLRAAT